MSHASCPVQQRQKSKSVHPTSEGVEAKDRRASGRAILAAVGGCFVDGCAGEDPELHPIAVASRVDSVKLAEQDVKCAGGQGVAVDGGLYFSDEVIECLALRKQGVLVRLTNSQEQAHCQSKKNTVCRA